MSMVFGSHNLVWIDLVRYGLVEILGEDWVKIHPVESLSDIKESNLVPEGVSASAAYGIAARAGGSLLAIFCGHFAPQMGFLESSFQLQPVQTRLAAGLDKVLALMVALGGAEIILRESDSAFEFELPAGETALLYLYSGFFEAYFEWASNGKTFLYQHLNTAEGRVVVSFNKQPLNV